MGPDASAPVVANTLVSHIRGPLIGQSKCFFLQKVGQKREKREGWPPIPSVPKLLHYSYSTFFWTINFGRRNAKIACQKFCIGIIFEPRNSYRGLEWSLCCNFWRVGPLGEFISGETYRNFCISEIENKKSVIVSGQMVYLLYSLWSYYCGHVWEVYELIMWPQSICKTACPLWENCCFKLYSPS